MENSTRRNFIKKTTLAASTIPFIGLPHNIWTIDSKLSKSSNEPLSVHIFSKHLQFIDDFREIGKIGSEMGFAGIDLTVRKNGHIEPKTVKTDLPKAIKEIEKGGSKCEMLTTAIESVHNPLDVDIIKTASKAGVKYYRPEWFRYLDDTSMEASIEKYKHQLKELSDLNESLGIIGCYQNYAGTRVGSSLWEIKQILADVNPDFMGILYDIRHNMVEGFKSWPNGLRLIQQNIKTIAIKDFKYTNENGIWKSTNVPIGEGMVDFKKYFKMLKNYNINVPVTLHMEYPLGGAEKGKRNLTIKPEVLFDTMKRDLITLNQLWKES